MGTHSHFIHTDGPLYQLSFKERCHWSCLILLNLRNEALRSGRFFFTKKVRFSWFSALSLWRHDQVSAKHQFDQNPHCQAALRAPSQTSDNGEVFQQQIFFISPSYFCKENVDILWVFCSLQMNERWDNDWYRGPTNIPRSEMPPKAYLLFVLIREK